VTRSTTPPICTRWLALWLAALAARALAGETPPREYLDEETGATVTAVAEPLVFAYPRRHLAANARDYATLAAASVNRGGRVEYVLIVYFWSTVDPRLREEPMPTAEPLAIQADDRRIVLRLRAHSAREAGIGLPVHAPPGATAPPNLYTTDLPAVRFMAAARQLALLADSNGTTLSYSLWADRRAALGAFVRHMSGAD
jgi:hypothetical protein